MYTVCVITCYLHMGYYICDLTNNLLVAAANNFVCTRKLERARHTRIGAYMNILTHAHAYTYTCVDARTHVCNISKHFNTCTRIHSATFIRKNARKQELMNPRTYAHIHTRAQTSTHTHTYTKHMYKYKHTHKHTYTQIHTH